MNSSFESPNEVEDKPPPTGCELENLKEKNLMQRNEQSSDFCTLLQHDEVAATSEERLEISKNSHPHIIIEEGHEPPSLTTRKAELKNHEEKCKLL